MAVKKTAKRHVAGFSSDEKKYQPYTGRRRVSFYSWNSRYTFYISAIENTLIDDISLAIN